MGCGCGTFFFGEGFFYGGLWFRIFYWGVRIFEEIRGFVFSLSLLVTGFWLFLGGFCSYWEFVVFVLLIKFGFFGVYGW